jgi:hypothetical protein
MYAARDKDNGTPFIQYSKSDSLLAFFGDTPSFITTKVQPKKKVKTMQNGYMQEGQYINYQQKEPTYVYNFIYSHKFAYYVIQCIFELETTISNSKV